MVLNDILNALEPYATLTDALSGENHVTVSAVMPLRGLVKGLDYTQTDESSELLC